MRSDSPIYQNPLVGRCPYHAAIVSSVFQSHWHSEMELLYLLPGSGAAAIRVDGERIALAPRELYIIDSTRIHSVESVDNGCGMLVLEVGYGLLGEDFAYFAKHRFVEPRISFYASDIPHEFVQLEGLLIEIASEEVVRGGRDMLEESSEALTGRMRVASQLYRLCYLLARYMHMTGVNGTRARELKSMLSIQRVMNEIKAHVDQPITVEAAASTAGYEKTRFCQLFKSAVGMPFHKYLTEYRLKCAARLLCDTELPISSVASSVGIPEGKTFARLFREKYGMTPSRYRAVNSPE